MLPSNEIFQMLMEKIEPDLLLDDAEREKKYMGESTSKRKKRFKRYKAAFKQYRKELQLYFQKLDAQIAAYCKDILQSAEDSSRTQERDQLLFLEEEFNSPLSS